MLLSYDLVCIIIVISLSFEIQLGQGFYCLPCCKLLESYKVLLSLGMYTNKYFRVCVNCLLEAFLKTNCLYSSDFGSCWIKRLKLKVYFFFSRWEKKSSFWIWYLFLNKKWICKLLKLYQSLKNKQETIMLKM